MRAITRFVLKHCALTIILLLLVIGANLSLQAYEIVDQDSPESCYQLYLRYPPNQQCTTREGLCTAIWEECIMEDNLDECFFGWEKQFWLFGKRYCVRQERHIYNEIELCHLLWPYAMAVSLVGLFWWCNHVLHKYRLKKAQILAKLQRL